MNHPGLRSGPDDAWRMDVGVLQEVPYPVHRAGIVRAVATKTGYWPYSAKLEPRLVGTWAMERTVACDATVTLGARKYSTSAAQPWEAKDVGSNCDFWDLDSLSRAFRIACAASSDLPQCPPLVLCGCLASPGDRGDPQCSVQKRQLTGRNKE